MLDSTYGFLNKEEKIHYASLLSHEINLFLKKIYSRMRRTTPLPPSKVSPSDLILRTAASDATKAWEFVLNHRYDVSKGRVGKIIVVTAGLKKRVIRRQRALLIAAEFYVYHSFANHPDERYFESVRSQNQYLDLLKHIFRGKPASDIRDRAIRYVIEEIGEHKLAHYSGEGWRTRIAKLEKHDPAIAAALGSSAKTFKSIVAKQHQVFTPDMLKVEDDLIRHEAEELDELIRRLEEHRGWKHSAADKKRIVSHLEALSSLRDSLKDIRKNIVSWERADTEEHELLKKRVISGKELKRLVASEAEAETVDINKVHILFGHFEKEKVNILHDIEVLDKIRRG